MPAILIHSGTKTARNNKAEEILRDLELEINENNSDLLIITNKEGKKSIGIGEVRPISKYLNEKPLNHKNKAVYIKRAEILTVQAQNALLKTLEEPPSYATIILEAKTEDALLETVISRCKRIRVEAKGGESTPEITEIDNYKSALEILVLPVGERLAWAVEASKLDRGEVLEILEWWIAELRNSLNVTNAKNIETISKVLRDMQNTNVATKLALENIVLQLKK